MRAKTLKRLYKLIRSLKGFADLTEIRFNSDGDDRYIVLMFEDEYFSVNVTGDSEIGAIMRVMELLNKISS